MRRAKSSGAKTARFFVHWRGRKARNQAGSRWGFSASGAGSSGASDAEVDEATLAHPYRVEDVTAVEDDRLTHQLLHPLEVGPTEVVPLGEDEESIGTLEGLVGRLGVADPVTEVTLRHLRRHRVMGGEGRALAEETFEHHQRRSLAHIVGAGLEGEPPDGEVLPGEVAVVLGGLLEEEPLLALVGALDRTEQIELDPEVARGGDQRL